MECHDWLCDSWFRFNCKPSAVSWVGFFLNSSSLQAFAVNFIIFAAVWATISSIISNKLYTHLIRLGEFAQSFISKKPLLPPKKDPSSLHELNQLEQVLLKAFTLAEEKAALENKLNQVTARLAHDITSPIMGLKLMLRQIPSLTKEQQVFLDRGSKQIDAMTKNFLEQYHEVRNKKKQLLVPADQGKNSGTIKPKKTNKSKR